MSSEKTPAHTENAYVRLNSWNNRLGARILLWLALGASRFAGLWQGSTRARIEGVATFCRNLARYIMLPETARLMASPELLRQTLVEACGFTFLLTLTISWTLLSVYDFLEIALVPVLLLVVVLCLLFSHLIYLLALSGDVYQRSQDEGQRQCSHQASADTLRIVGFFVVAFSLCLAFLPGWRTWVAIDLAALLLLARLLYLARLAQLRWAMLTLVSLEDEDAMLAEEQ
ncbi:MAG TPA: hypothetical protein VGD98_04960 [Ktedonobacteraceae bacterium]